MKTFIAIIMMLLLATAHNDCHYFPVAEVNHIVEVNFSLEKIALKYVLWVPGGDDSVIMKILDTFYPRFRITDDVFDAYAGWSIYHYEDCLNAYLDGERIRFAPVEKPVNFASFGLVFQYEHRFTKKPLKGTHNFLLVDNNDVNVQKSTEELLLIADKHVKLRKQLKTRRRIESKISFRPPKSFVLPPPQVVKTITGLAAPSDDIVKFSGFVRPPEPEALTGLADK